MDNNVEGAICPKCAQNNEIHQLKFFYISFEEMVLKCESSTCLFPFKNFKCKNVKDGSIFTITCEDDNTSEIVNSVNSSVSPNWGSDQVVNTQNDTSQLQESKLETNYAYSEFWGNEYNFLDDILENPIVFDNQVKADIIEPFQATISTFSTSSEQGKDADRFAQQHSSAQQDQGEQQQSTTATISKYLELIKAKHKKGKVKNNKSSSKSNKNTKTSISIADGDKVKTSPSKNDQSLGRPLDILKKIQQL